MVAFHDPSLDFSGNAYPHILCDILSIILQQLGDPRVGREVVKIWAGARPIMESLMDSLVYQPLVERAECRVTPGSTTTLFASQSIVACRLQDWLQLGTEIDEDYEELSLVRPEKCLRVYLPLSVNGLGLRTRLL